jgi:hypothetical protein
VCPALAQRYAGAEQNVGDRARYEDLAALRERGDARRDVDADAATFAPMRSHSVVWMPACTSSPSRPTERRIARAPATAAVAVENSARKPSPTVWSSIPP